MFIWFATIEKTPPTIEEKSIMQFINFDNPDLLTIISLVEEISININVKKYKTYLSVLENSII